MAGEWTKAAFEGFSESGTATEAVRGVFGDGPVEQVAGFFGEGTVSGGGSWSFDPDQIKTVIGEWESLLEDLSKDAMLIEHMATTGARPPSEDEPTNGYVRQILHGVASLRSATGSFRGYVAGFIEQLQGSKMKYDEQESVNTQAFSGGQ